MTWRVALQRVDLSITGGLCRSSRRIPLFTQHLLTVAKKYRFVILAAKRNLESFDWSLITQAFLLRKYRFSSLIV